ncbi:MAG: chemotaxis response regulator protein-glutamate methylesterase [Thermoleophilia bacterium]|nr:chemotaxis response regulator protein-glutamate methylesterase [Thermoleophilia bacterium]
MPPKARVLICDDSPLMRRVLSDLLTDGGLEVVAQVSDGADLVAGVQRHTPDVVTLDVEMPRKDGLSALADLMKAQPTPVIMCSTLTGKGARESVKALQLGAVDVVQKPALRLTPSAWGPTRDELVAKVREAAMAKVRAIRPAPSRPAAVGRPAPAPAAAPPVSADLAARARGTGSPLVIIATSTGGPRALHEVVPRLPGELGCGVLIVQHMPVGFTKTLAERLDSESALTVREARPTDRITPDVALVAPAGSHLEVSAIGATRLSDAPPIGNLKPRADITISSAAKVYGSKVLLVVLTGMGNDGELGARDLKQVGGRILSEDERTCVIYGMPRAVKEAGLSDGVVPLDVMPLAIVETIAAWGRTRKAA